MSALPFRVGDREIVGVCIRLRSYLPATATIARKEAVKPQHETQPASLLLHQPLELDPVQYPAPERPRHELLELPDVLPEQLGGLVVERVVGIGLVEQINESIYDRVDVEHRLPVLPKDVEAHLPLQVNVGVVNLGPALDFGRAVRVVVGNGKGEVVRRLLPVPRVGRDGDVEVGQVVRVGEGDGGNLAGVKLGNV
jgi:hypothetical protein